jgi:3alpha(or 20beta)-hydroxysteroid dehydrogenase
VDLGLRGRRAVVTGGTKGIGRAVVEELLGEGVAVAFCARNADEVKAAEEELLAAGDVTVAGWPTDVTDPAAVQHFIDAAADRLGGVDVLVNNAGILRFAALPDMPLEDYMRVVNVNQVGTFLGMRAVSKPMIAAGRGSIVNISSVEGLAGMPYLTAYTSTKFAIRGMTKVAALELGPNGIRVNSVHPGMIETDMVKDAAGGHDVDLSPAAKRIPLRRMGTSEDIAQVVLFLASDRSAYVTGAEVAADGGATATHAFYMV